jgi:hypothetical protein
MAKAFHGAADDPMRLPTFGGAGRAMPDAQLVATLALQSGATG